MKTCKKCKHWKPEQAELDYSKFVGICTCDAWKFDSKNVKDVMLLDRQNLSNKCSNVQRFENQNNVIPFGVPNKSRYCLVTAEGFGCIHREEI